MATVATFDVFLSHNSRDKATVERIAERLARAGLTPWFDKWTLVPGGRWEQEMGAGIEASRACAVFIGPEDLGGWHRAEAEVALNRATNDGDFRVFPVLLPDVAEPFEPNRLPPFLRTRTWVDFRRGYEDTRALQDLIHAIRGIPFGPSVVVRSDDVCPYRGLQVFDAEHSEFYFGRDAEIQRLLEKLKTDRFLAVLGPSGSGKSSLVRAGLVPQLIRGGARSSVVRPGAAPLTAIAAAIAALAPGTPMQATLDGLGTDPRTLHLAVVQALGTEERLVLVVDQLEEAFTLCHDEAERRAFFSNLLFAAAAPAGPCVVVLTLRADFYPRLAPYPELSQLVSGQQFLVGPMNRAAARQAIEEPARRVGLEFEEGLIDTILDDAGHGPGTLPLLEYALLELWERRRGTMLTLEGYRDAGGVDGALAKRADELLASLDPAEQDQARRALLRLTQPGEGTEDTRRRARVSELAGMEDVLDDLVAARLLTVDHDEIEVSHEALIRAWPRLRGWIDADRAGLRVQRRVTDAAGDWERLDRDESALLRGARLAEAREYDGELNALERELVDASVELAEREQREREAQAQRELAAVRRGRRRLTFAAAALLAGFVIAGIAAVLALNQKRVAERERNVALSRQLAASSTLELPQDPQLGVQLAREAARTAHTSQAEDALRAALQSPIRMTYRGLRGTPDGVAVSARGDRIAALDDGGTVAVWDMRGGPPLAVVPKQGSEGPEDIAFSPDGTRLVIGNAAGRGLVELPARARATPAPAGGDRLLRFDDPQVELLDASDGRVVRRIGPAPPSPSHPVVSVGESQGIHAAAFVAGGRRFVTTGTDGTQLWDARTGALVRPLDHGHGGGLEAVSVDAGGDRFSVAVTVTDVTPRPTSVRVWDARNGKLILSRSGPAGGADGILSPDGRRVLFGRAILDVDSRRSTRVACDFGQSTAFSPDGSVLATSQAGGVALCDGLTGQSIGSLQAGSSEPVALTFAPDGELITAGGDGAVRRWALGIRRLAYSGPLGDEAAADVKGSLVAGMSGLDRPLVWNAASGRLVSGAPTEADDDSGDELHFTGDGLLVAYQPVDGGTTDRYVVLDPASGQRRRALFGTSVDARATHALTESDSGDDTKEIVSVPGSKRLTVPVPDSRALAPGGREVAVASGQDIVVWNLFTGRRQARLAAGGSSADSLTFSRDGRRLLSTSGGEVFEYDLATGQRIALPSHRGDELNSASFSNDGRYVVSSGADGVINVSDAAGGYLLVTLPSSGAAAMLADDRHIVTLGEDGPPIIRTCDGCGTWPQLLARIDARRLPALTPAERRRYVR